MHVNIDCLLVRSDLRATHCVAVAPGYHGIGAEARHDGDVIALGRIEVNLAWIHCSLQRRIRAALTVTDVAHGCYPEQFLARLARDGADTALRHHRHVTGMEVDRDVTNGCARIGRLNGWIDPDGAVFLDNPAVVGDCNVGLAVLDGNREVAGGGEIHRNCGRHDARRVLRIHRGVTKRHCRSSRASWGARGDSGEGSVRIECDGAPADTGRGGCL